MDFKQVSLVSHPSSNVGEVWCKKIDLSFFHPPTLKNKFCKNNKIQRSHKQSHNPTNDHALEGVENEETQDLY